MILISKELVQMACGGDINSLLIYIQVLIQEKNAEIFSV